ncbi:MAG: hypothetical protein KR126chlam3_00888 [Chlamydiae bacterium]|nr:hypothetical protein [Chlamydiota bacterium]
MSCFSKNIYISKEESIPVDRDSWQKKEFQQEKCQYQGRSYEVHQVIERPLKYSERVKVGLQALIAIIATLGIALIFSSTVRERCSQAINGKEREIYWKPTPKSVPESAPNPSSLNFDRFALSQGFSLTKARPEEKNAFNKIVETWKTRDSSKKDWAISELATFLKQEETALQKLFDLVFLIPNSRKNYPTFGLEKLFQALESSLSDELKLSCQPGVKILWFGRMPTAATVFGKGSDKESWKLEELERFLAVSQDALIDFLGERKEQYSTRDIDKALNSAGNRQINEILEKNRTQSHSIRWDMIA